jgi:hypothetical protein
MVGVPTHSDLRRCWASSELSDLIMLRGMRIRTRVGSFLSRGTWKHTGDRFGLIALVLSSAGDRLIALAFRYGFCHLLRASEYLNPSGSKLSRHCILAKHVLFQYRTGLDEMRLVSGADYCPLCQE